MNLSSFILSSETSLLNFGLNISRGSSFIEFEFLKNEQQNLLSFQVLSSSFKH